MNVDAGGAPQVLEPIAVRWGLEDLAACLPRREIYGEEGLYLSRYTLVERADGGRVYLHHFHRSDADAALHNHPWAGRSLILAGGYQEERLDVGRVIRRRAFRPGDVNTLEPDTFHRVDLLTPETGCWTLFETGPREQSWGFFNVDTGTFTPWREALRARGLPITEPT